MITRLMTRRLLRMFGVLAAGTVMLTACGGGPASEEADGDVVELSYLGPQATSALAPVIAAFEAEHPNIKVNYESVPFADFNSVIQTRLGSGQTLPDIYTADQPRVQALVSREFLLDLTDRVTLNPEDYVASTIEASTVDGRLYALPSSTSTAVLYYNVDLLAKAEVDAPTADPERRWTWEETVKAATEAKAGGARYGLILDQVSRPVQFLPLAESLGGGDGVTGDDNLTPDITNPAWVRAAAFYGSLYADGLAPRGVSGPETAQLFANGEIAFFVGGPWHTGTFEKAANLSYGIAAHPYFDGGQAVTPTGSYSRGVNPNSEHVAEALEFLEFETMTDEGSLLAAEGQAIPPARDAALNDYLARPVWSEGEKNGSAALIDYELRETARIRPPTPGYVEFEEIIGTALEDIANGADAEPRLQRASQDLENAWSRIRGRR